MKQQDRTTRHVDTGVPRKSLNCVGPERTRRPRAYEEASYLWNIGLVPHTISVGGQEIRHPARSCAVFVVHGMGQQRWAATAVQLRSGFEDALEEISKWQRKRGIRIGTATIPSPCVFEGYWADYADLQSTFQEQWAAFNEQERDFFADLWRFRVFSIKRTLGWFIAQQLRLLHPTVLREVGLFAWLLYWPLQFVSLFTLLIVLLRHPKILTEILSDVRLYLDPRGLAERAIVQRIDYRVGKAFLRMIGLDWEFRPLPLDQLSEASGELLSFERIVWVAHSLGTVISYNVLSDLFHRADDLGTRGDAEQKQGVKRFRGALRRFVTMGSPLDKVAFLFAERTLRPWPKGQRRTFLEGGEIFEKDQAPDSGEWWVNFYHVLDPVSGALSSPLICGDQPPANLHIRSGFLPGWAHVAYWSDLRTLRFILGRTYGKLFLHDQEYRPLSPLVLTAIAACGYLIWAMVLIACAFAIIQWGPRLIGPG